MSGEFADFAAREYWRAYDADMALLAEIEKQLEEEKESENGNCQPG